MLKVGIYDPYLDTLGGGERYCLTVAEILLKQGYQVDLFWSGDKTLLDKANNRFSLNLLGINILPDIFIFNKTSVFKKFSITSKYDLFFYLSDGSIPFLFSKNNLLHVQVPFNKRLTTANKILNLIKLTFFKNIVCNSQFTQKFVDKNLSTKTIVLYPPIDIDKFNAITSKGDIILSVGRFDNILNAKRQDVLISAFKTLFDHNHNLSWKLILAGGSLEKPENNSYLKHLKYISLKYPIEFIVNPDFDVLRNLYSQAKIYWHAAGFEVDEKLNPENTEHFGMAVVEAMASGSVPVIVSKGGLNEIISDKVDGFLWHDTKELVSKTQHLIGSPILLAKMSKSAIIKSAKFSKENFQNKLLSICSK